eukprot:TRINITY_DN46_c0_g1_i1.p4 TRINITY_DN46_c0_g1~~TRINITY_DN46_c0_g1_i1.p4  ORF type:complete len:120 (-),score=8.39 TRINITY_DN46_c0_g1_i1:549-908(-)
MSSGQTLGVKAQRFRGHLYNHKYFIHIFTSIHLKNIAINMKILAVVLLLVCLFAEAQCICIFFKDYKIKKDDTLWRISRSCKIQVPIFVITSANSGECIKSRDLLKEDCIIRIPCHCYP